MAGVSIDLLVVYFFLFISIYFEVFLLVAFIERRFRPKEAARRATFLPKVAIVVPCYNEEKTISSTIMSLLSLAYPSELLEIIVVDDGSLDRTLERARGFEYEARVRVLHKENGGKYSAMNCALAETSADLIGCLDADSVVESGALFAMVPLFEDARIAAVTPGIHVRNPRTILQHMQHVEYRLSIFNRFVLSLVGSAFITPGPFSIFRASVVRELGGWRHGHSTEDMEMALRVQKMGHLIANVPRAIVYTGTPSTLSALFRQRVRWTYGWLRNALDYRSMFFSGEYGNLGLLVLPAAIISIFAGIYFFARVVFLGLRALTSTFELILATGVYPHPSFDLFYVNTSALWFLIFFSIGLIIVLLFAGTSIGTDGSLPPRATPLFLIFYSFLVPMWLSVAVYRAAFKTGVRWR